MRRVVRDQRQAARGCIQRSARIEISISRFIDFIVDSYELRSGIRITNRYNYIYIYIYKIRRMQRVISTLLSNEIIYRGNVETIVLDRFRLRAIEFLTFEARRNFLFLKKI